MRDTELYSPFNGQVSKVHVIPGGYVERGRPVVTVQMMDPMKVEIAVSPETDRKINYNDVMKVHIDGHKEPIKGVVWLKDTVADAATRTFMVTLLIRNFRVETEVPAKTEKDLPLAFPVLPGVRPGRYVVPIDVKYGPWQLPQFAEAIVDI